MDINSPDANLASAPQLRFGKIDGPVHPRLRRHRRRPQTPFLHPARKRATGAANSKPTPTLESDYILLHTLLGHRPTPNVSAEPQTGSSSIRIKMADGVSTPPGPSNISASVKAYFGLKARRILRRSSRPPARPQKKSSNSAASPKSTPSPRSISASSDKYDYDAVPAIPPEIVLFPNWFWFNNLRDFLVVARHSRPPFHLLRQEAVQENSRAKWASKNYSSAA